MGDYELALAGHERRHASQRVQAELAASELHGEQAERGHDGGAHDGRIAALNREFLNREGPTNVIAFPMQEGRFAELSPALLGDVVISVDTAAAEAERAGIAFERRLVELLVHGVLHLCGYDHEHDRALARRMAAKSRAVMKLIEESVQF